MAASEGTLLLDLVFLLFIVVLFSWSVFIFVHLVQIAVDAESTVFTSGIVIQTAISNSHKSYSELRVDVNIYQLRLVSFKSPQPIAN